MSGRGPQHARAANSPPLIVRFELLDDLRADVGAGTGIDATDWSADALVASPEREATAVGNRYIIDGDDTQVIKVWDACGSWYGFGGRSSIRGSMGYAIWMSDSRRYEILSMQTNVLPAKTGNGDEIIVAFDQQYRRWFVVNGTITGGGPTVELYWPDPTTGEYVASGVDVTVEEWGY